MTYSSIKNRDNKKGKNSLNSEKHIKKEEKANYKEVQLKRKSKRCTSDPIKNYLREVAQHKLLTFEEEKELSRKVQNGEEEALNTLINSNLRLVIKIAKGFVSQSYQLIDVIQDGNIGLIRAANKYDYKKNVRFSTYASKWIKQMIIRALSKKKRIVKIPYRKEKDLRRIDKITDKYMEEHNRCPSNRELAEELGIDVKKIKKIKFSDISVSYIEDTINNTQTLSLEDLITDNNYNPYETIINKDIKEDTCEALNSLLPKERSIIIHRFGIHSNEKYTLKEMGGFFGISPETVRQIEVKSLKKLEATYQNLKDYIYG